MSQIFISYAHEDQALAIRLNDDLERDGFDPWLNCKRMEVGVEWEPTVEIEIQKSRYFLALISQQSLDKRGYIQKEIKLALRVVERLPFGDRFLLPIRIEKCDIVDPRLRRLHAFDLIHYEDDYPRLVASIDGARREQQRAVAEFYADSGLEIPSDIATWESVRLFQFIERSILPEAFERARRDYENTPDAQDPAALRERAFEKVDAIADSLGFIDRWRRWPGRREADSGI